MRWVSFEKVASIALLTLALGSTGCTAALLQNAGRDPEVLAALPFALVGDAILYSLKAAAGARGSVTVVPQSSTSLVTWRDPDDWVADCEGPVLCADYEQFECRGVPGDCSCACVVSPPAQSVARAAHDDGAPLVAVK